jgi:hypothetical protein
MRVHKTILAAITLTAGLALSAGVASAAECKDGHFHYGSGTNGKTKRAALKTAVLAWREFTAWEYGVPWAYWKRAAGKSVECTKSGKWSCSVSASPCRK